MSAGSWCVPQRDKDVVSFSTSDPDFARRCAVSFTPGYLQVRDPAHPEPLDPEIIPLCDALNAAGFVTTSSCCGHGGDWPYVWFADTDGARIDRLARFVIARLDAVGDHRPYFALFQRETQAEGYAWCVELHLNDLYRDTPASDGLAMAVAAINGVAALVEEFARTEPDPPCDCAECVAASAQSDMRPIEPTASPMMARVAVTAARYVKLQSALDALATAVRDGDLQEIIDAYKCGRTEEEQYAAMKLDAIQSAISSLLSTRETSNGSPR